MDTETTVAVADLIREYNPRMAGLYLARPFHRVTIAKAVAAGIRPVEGQHDYEMGKTLVTLAEMERDERLEKLEGEQ